MTQQEFTMRYSYDPKSDMLGSGGFGSVYKAYDNDEDRFVALKIAAVDPLHPWLRLREEVNTAHPLKHRNVARYDACYTFTTFSGEMDIAVMHYYEHGSLDGFMRKGDLSMAERHDILTQILEGIAYLHQHGVIHRDLKPQNVLMVHHAGRYIPKITDFGISKQLDDGESSLVDNSVVGGGTRSYASPEQLCEREIRKNTDLWSFGVIAYYMLVGELPFTSGTLSPSSDEGRSEQLRRIVSGKLPDRIGSVPEPWQSVIRGCLVVDGQRRFQHAEDCLAIVRSSFGGCTPPKDGGPFDERTQLGNGNSGADVELDDDSDAATNAHNGHVWVDLGLSVKWATCNVGASSPEQYGNYYAWGETSPKSSYTEDNCKTLRENTITKSSFFGLIKNEETVYQGIDIGDIAGNATYDAARANWGGKWRMPTDAEFEELRNTNNCTWTWTTQNGKNGYKVTSKKNGNSIFLPAAGFRYGTDTNYDGSYGRYWSSTPTSDAQTAYYLYFYGDRHPTIWYRRDYGRSVRPVLE